MISIYQVIDFLHSTISSKPRRIPPAQFDKFTMRGKMRVVNYFRDDSYPSFRPIVITKDSITSFVKRIKKGENPYYGPTDAWLRQALKKYASHLKSAEGVDVGSVSGWYSAFALAYGAKKSNIIEYNRLISTDPRVVPIRAREFDRHPRQFDFATSISSFEHDGLGRYGDPINPNGDLETMKKMKKIVKKNGLLFLSVPVGEDTIVWNLHRIYGRHRLPKLLSGWKLVDSFGFKDEDLVRGETNYVQPVFVLRNI